MAKITVQQISRRAKATRKKGEPWINAIKRASRELKGTKSASTTRKAAKKRSPKKRRKIGSTATRQTGTSNLKRDKQRRALKPGKRKSASGATYYERRRNRSDRPGKLAGVAMGSLKSELLTRAKELLATGLLARDTAKTLKQHKAAVKKITAARKAMRAAS
jgi:hypothetical protein